MSDTKIQSVNTPSSANDHVMAGIQAQNNTDAPSAKPAMSANPLPVNLRNLLLKIIAQRSKLFCKQPTDDFKSALAQAKDLVTNLPGGELLIEDQDEVIHILETLRDRKRAQLERFSRQPLRSSTLSASEQKMEIDSMASTPAND
ncbi:hypothetical protein P691DRAFT_761253 [Macrolepiota fuliginosa MF-IS2]|uniref:Mediator complex subunit 9 n=1 Tax=Macrolepiota fuliginosa MF-IS2 TaxID=1400762 RepID=A0A9P5X903_9AGAR|nr:hypothetical protein P691DRAFT_761253 [Macrolepiota fuliginosa MF-IS2]